MQCLEIKEEVEEFLEIETSVQHRSYVPKLFLSKDINQEFLCLVLSFGFLGSWVGFSMFVILLVVVCFGLLFVFIMRMQDMVKQEYCLISSKILKHCPFFLVRVWWVGFCFVLFFLKDLWFLSVKSFC